MPTELTTKPSIAKIPRHVAIIMDGNGRWAHQRGKNRLEGHQAGAESVRRTVEECRKLGIQYLTLFSFSTENWGRSSDEVSGLMELFTKHLEAELNELMKAGIRLQAIGDLERLPESVQTLLRRDIEQTKNNSDLTLILALSYGSREEIATAARRLAGEVKAGRLEPEEITPATISRALWTDGIPDPELLIRTSGEMRISNFLLWQLAYAEIVVIETLWPDFDVATLHHCLNEYQKRERRFGLTSEQIQQGVSPLIEIN